MVTIKIVLDRRSTRADGTCPVKLYASYQRKVVMVGTGYYAREDRWDEREYYRKEEPNYKLKNVRLRGILAEVEGEALRMEEVSLEGIREAAERAAKGKVQRRKEKKRFVDYVDGFMGLKTKEGTLRVYRTTRKKVEEFDGEARFETMTADWLRRFEAWMEGKGCDVNYRSIQLRNIRAVFNWAIDNEWTEAYPFRRFKIRTKETAKRSLTVEQLRMLRDYPVEAYQEKYRDMFMLMFYLIGINGADLFRLPPLQGDYVVYHRAKTGRLYEVRVEPEARAIIERYRGKEFMLDVGDEYRNYQDFVHWMNVGLKRIGKLERVGRGGKKVIEPLFPEISAYWARHTWATIAAELDIPKETIAAALGHAQRTTTDIYIRFDRRKVDEANRRVIDWVNGEGAF